MKLRVKINDFDVYEINTNTDETKELTYSEFNRLVARLNSLGNLMDGMSAKENGKGKRLKIYEGRTTEKHFIPPTPEQVDDQTQAGKLGRRGRKTKFTREQAVEFVRRYYKIITGDAEEGDSKEKLMEDNKKSTWIRTIQNIHRFRKIHNLTPQECGLNSFPNQLKKGKSNFKKIQVIPTPQNEVEVETQNEAENLSNIQEETQSGDEYL